MATDEKRMQLRGLHHVTAICRDAERTIAFYRDLMGLAVVHDGPSDDDPESRHVWFGAQDGRAGMLVSFMQYPELPTGVVGIGSTHHFAFMVDSAEEQEAWRDYLRGQGVECTDVFDRGAFRSIYIRDPDGHIVEIATSGPGFPTGGPKLLLHKAGTLPPVPASPGLLRGPAHARHCERVHRRDLRDVTAQATGQRAALAVGHRTNGLRLRHGNRSEEPSAARAAPPVLAQQQVGDRHALGLPRALEHDVPDSRLPLRDLPLELSPRQAHTIRLGKCAHVLRRRGRRCCVHGTSPLPAIPAGMVVICVCHPAPGTRRR
jgi:glyoxylase I family protein